MVEGPVSSLIPKILRRYMLMVRKKRRVDSLIGAAEKKN